MRIKDLMTYIREAAPNVFPDWLLLNWLNEVEGRVQLDIWLRAPEEVVTYKLPEDEQTQLLLTAADAGIYRSYLKAMVLQSTGEYSKYQNEMERFNAAWNEYACRYLERQAKQGSENR